MFLGGDWWEIIIGFDNGLVPNEYKTIIYTMFICVNWAMFSCDTEGVNLFNDMLTEFPVSAWCMALINGSLSYLPQLCAQFCFILLWLFYQLFGYSWNNVNHISMKTI